MRIKGYEIVERVKETDYLTVYRGVQTALDRQVLLKVLKPQFSAEEKIGGRLRQEAQTLARISHPNVVQIYDFGEEAHRLYLAMEYFQSRDFARVLSDDGPPSIPSCISSLRQVLRGLCAVHAEGIYHRDIKPANLLLGEQGQVKITDFGLAALQGATGLTVEGSVIGTPRYLAPEQISGETANSLTEVYAVGVTFYEICTGIPPFEADSYSAVFHRIITEDPTPPKELREEIPDELSDLLLRMMAKNPRSRYPDCQTVLDKVDRMNDKADTPQQERTGETEIDGEQSPFSGWKKFTGLSISLLVILFAFLVLWRFSENPLQSEAPGAGQGADENAVITELPGDTADHTGVVGTPEESLEIRAQMEDVALGDREPVMTDPVRGHQGSGSGTTDMAATKLPDTISEEGEQVRESLLSVGVVPWGAVYINGDSVGKTPLNEPFMLAPGQHEIRIHHPNLPELTKRITLEPGAAETLLVNLIQQSSYLSLAVYPWARVYIDGELIDETPIPEPLVLSPGRHLIQLRHPDYQLWQKYVELLPGDTMSLRIKL